MPPSSAAVDLSVIEKQPQLLEKKLSGVRIWDEAIFKWIEVYYYTVEAKYRFYFSSRVKKITFLARWRISRMKTHF